MKNIYTSIDIGSDSIKVVVLELIKNKLNLLAASSFKSKGVKKGVITNIEEATASLKGAINEIETMLGVKIKKVIASVPSYFTNFIYVKSEIEITSEEKVISDRDIVKVLQKSVIEKRDLHNELVTILPIDFYVDDQVNIKDPKGLPGNILGARSIIVNAPKKNIYSVVNLIEGLGIEVIDISLNSIGDSFVFKNKENSDQIGAIINIGSETTEVSIYNKGIIVKNAVIGLGGKNIDNDIAYIYNISLSDARKLKEKFALGHKLYATLNDYYEVKTLTGENIRINQFEISEVVMSRLEEILTIAKNEINVLAKKQMEYVIVTGGTSHMEHISYIIDDVFGKNVVVGDINIVGVRHNKYSAVVGNVIYFINKLKLKGKQYTMFGKEDITELSSSKRSILNVESDSMLGTVFGFFTGE